MTPATSPRPSVKEKTVFVIDDDEIIVEIISHMLEASGLSKIHGLSTATDALELLKHLKPDIIITDVHMPELSGTFFAKLVADYPQLQDVPVLAVTADDSSETLELAKKNGMFDVIYKPIDARVLIEKVFAAIEFADTNIRLKEENRVETSNKTTTKENGLYGLFGRANSPRR